MANIPIQGIPDSLRTVTRYGIKKEIRTQIESDPKVQLVIGTGLLLTQELNILLNQIVIGSNKINGAISSLKTPTYPSDVGNEWIKDAVAEINDLSTKGAKATDDLINKIANKYRLQSQKKKREEIVNKTKEDSNQLEKETSNFFSLHGSIDILDQKVFHYCKKCSLIVAEGSFKKVKCPCGSIINDPSDCSQISFSTANENLLKFVNQNIWLEIGVEKLFTKAGYGTLCGYYLLGTSGVSHEIDVYAESGAEKEITNRAISECKAQEINITDVLILYGKMQDIGCFEGYLFSTGSELTRDVHSYAKSKGIKIIKGILEANKDNIISELKTKALSRNQSVIPPSPGVQKPQKTISVSPTQTPPSTTPKFKKTEK